MIPSSREIAYGLYGAWRLARLDAGGMGYFDRTVEGFWKSFFAAVLVAPGYAILVAVHLSESQLASNPLRLLTVQLIAYVISWTAFPVAIYYLAEGLGKGRAFIPYIVAFNWAKVIQMVVYLPISLISIVGVLPLQAVGLLNLVVSLAILAYEWYITRIGFGVGALAAVAIVVLDLILGILVTAIADGMLP